MDDNSLSQNPLLEDFYFPPFDVIQPKHISPGIHVILAQLNNDFDELENTVEPTWPKLVEPLGKIGDRLSMLYSLLYHFKFVKDSDDLRSAFDQVLPDMTNFRLRVKQSKPIYNAFKAIQDSPDWPNLSDVRKRVVEYSIKSALVSGVSLEGDKRDLFNTIEQEINKLSVEFDENVLDSTKKFEKLVTDKKKIEGLPPSAFGLAAQTAVSKGHVNADAENGPWIITLDGPSYLSVLKHAKNRSLREEVYRAYISIASCEDHDNTPIIEQLLKLKFKKAKLLGYNNYAEVSMVNKMATLEKVEELVERLRVDFMKAAMQDMEELKTFSKSQGAVEADDLTHWDVCFWSERLRESKYGIDEEKLRQYFSLSSVMNGLFTLSSMLFGVEIVASDGLAPVWNTDVRFYCVKDSTDNSPVAYFYFDPYSRPSEKRGGAWFIGIASGSQSIFRDGSVPRLPIGVIGCNQGSPIGSKPSLMTFREVETIFHEFGHALQYMLSKKNGVLVGIEHDAIELPSMFMENWCYHRNTLFNIAKHYETGESIPEDIYLKLLSARTFNVGSSTLRLVHNSIVDLELHSRFNPNESIFDVYRRICEKTQVISPLLEDKFLCRFSHIFAGGMSAGYYSYMWCKILSADAFSAFEDAGLDVNKAMSEIGRRFRDTILTYGGEKATLEDADLKKNKETDKDNGKDDDNLKKQTGISYSDIFTNLSEAYTYTHQTISL